MSKINMFKMDAGLFGHNYRVATLSTLYLTVLGIIITSLKSIRQFCVPILIKQKIAMLKIDLLTSPVLIIELLRYLQETQLLKE